MTMKPHQPQTILSLLETCKSMHNLKQIHSLLITTSLIKHINPLAKLIDFCANSPFGDIDYAISVFRQTKNKSPSLYIFNSVVKAFSNKNNHSSTLSLYAHMQQLGLSPDHFTFPFVLRSCAKHIDLKLGECVHCRIIKTGFEPDLYVSSCLIHMYMSCACIENARLLFENMPFRNVVVWTTLIAGYVDNNRATEALEVFNEMELAGLEPNEFTWVNVLTACGQTKDLEAGKRVYDRLCRTGFDPICRPNVILATAILDMYARCGSLKVARGVFDLMRQRNVVSWNVMISGYNKFGYATEAISLFVDMLSAGVKTDKVTLLGLLGSCAQLGALVLGRAVHAYVEKTNNCEDVAIATAILDMYAKTGDIESTLGVFKSLEGKDVVAWTSLIIGLAMNGRASEALGYFREMQASGLDPDHITYMGVLSACSHSGLVEEGRRQFELMKGEHGIVPSVEHYGCMVDLLSRSGHLEEAKALVGSMPIKPNVIIWSALLNGSQLHGDIGVVDQVHRMVFELNPQGSGVYMLLSNAYAKVGSWQRVKMAREVMRLRGIKKNTGVSFLELKALDSLRH